MATCDATTLVDDARCLVAAMNDRQLLASIVCLLATQNGMSCDATTLIAASKCLWMGMSERQLLASIAYNICNGGGSGGGFTFTSGAGDPPEDGSVTTQGWLDTNVPGRKFINVAWPDTAAPQWEAF